MARMTMAFMLTLALAVPPAARGQTDSGVAVLPEGHLFKPLRADPREPGFFAEYLWTTSAQRHTGVGSVGLGDDIGLFQSASHRWRLSVAAGVFSQFDMRTPSRDLLNTDFLIGFPWTWVDGPWSFRGRVYHQSSHLGDEYLLHSGATRVNYSFEATELLVSRDAGPLRVYAGGEYLFDPSPRDLKRGLWHAGLEWTGTAGRLPVGQGTYYVALDAKASEERNWRVGWDGRLGWEFGPPAPSARRWRVELHGFRGPSPYGQFYGLDVSAVGAGIHFEL